LTPFLAREDIVYRCFARLNTCAEHPEVPRMLRDSGCVHASFGVESGSPKILTIAAMHKNQTADQIRRGLTNAHKAGLRARIFLIVGFPGETDETVTETLALIKSCPWDEFSVYPLIAYPGTPLHDRPQDFGITHIDTNYSDYLQIGKNFRAGFTIRTATFDEHKVRQWRDRVIEELLADGRTWAGNSQGFK
jgi:anaerobic magnesium-protoporphyrin IX monomethyl ester cyclase